MFYVLIAAVIFMNANTNLLAAVSANTDDSENIADQNVTGFFYSCVLVEKKHESLPESEVNKISRDMQLYYEKCKNSEIIAIDSSNYFLDKDFEKYAYSLPEYMRLEYIENGRLVAEVIREKFSAIIKIFSNNKTIALERTIVFNKNAYLSQFFPEYSVQALLSKLY